MLREFMNFIRQHGVPGLAIAVILGGKVNALVSSTVEGILMPVAAQLSQQSEFGSDWGQGRENSLSYTASHDGKSALDQATSQLVDEKQITPHTQTKETIALGISYVLL